MKQTSSIPKRTIQKNELWRRGILVWKLDPVQKEMYQRFYESKDKIQVWLLARRNGKSFGILTLGIEQCLRKKNSIVKILAPTKLQINNIVRPIIRKILEDCPEDIAPQIKEKDYIYYFPNGSELQLAGTDGGHAEKLRGGDADLCLIDEAGSCDDLKTIVTDILMPTTLITGGKIIIAGTPSAEPDHEYNYYIEQAELQGTLLKKTIYENPRLTAEQIEDFAKEMGGKDSDAFKRECLCEIIKSEKESVFPEVTEDLLKEIVREWIKPVYYDAYVAMDLGGSRDLTAIIFGYYDFRNDKIIIEDELIYPAAGPNALKLPNLVKDVVAMETKLWFNHLTNEEKSPYVRVSDINKIVTDEIYRMSTDMGKKLVFHNAKKDDSGAAINNLRVLLANKKIIIHPRCVTLIRHIKNCRWKKGSDSDFARSPDDGHYDAAAALKYFVRAIQFKRNPFPANYGLLGGDIFVQNEEKFRTKPGSGDRDIYRKIFNIKKR